MKVTEKGRAEGGSRGAIAQRFDEVLRNARRGVRAPHRSPAVAGVDERAGAPRSLRARRASADHAGSVLRERRADAFEAERLTRPPPAPVAQLQPARIEGVADLRAIVRTLPAAIEAARVREGEPLSLSLGRALSVDLRRGAGGLELVLRPDAVLQRAAAAELPGLLETLRARGIVVARAEVRAQPHAGPPAGRSAR
ncbi:MULTISPECIES: hypothetical protein [Anaeromyxobacter]|uniref:hypothetical protein n=1 Tax=Anaeromyxobacter TaxID=161492 RepID=UPI001F57BEBF|nr:MULTISPECIES: hypothetical protein [unclassified Anaeromyxobacter]